VATTDLSKPRNNLSREFIALWEEHVARERKRADLILDAQIAAGTRKRRHLPQAHDIKERKANTAELLPLEKYDYIIVSFSGGKDSLACVLHLLDLGVPREKIELWHQAVDGEPGKAPRFFDWPITEDYCRAVGEALGIRTLFQWREGGFEGELLKTNARSKGIGFQMLDGRIEHAGGEGSTIATRRKFPVTGLIKFGRWCSSALKIDVARLAFNNDPRFDPKRLHRKRTLFIKGERGEESKNRALYAQVEKSSARGGTITEWHPILDWREPHVWDIISRYRVRPHPAYHVGFSRVSCMPCIFGNEHQWATVNTLDPKLMQKIARYEREFHRSKKEPGTIHETQNVLERAKIGTGYLTEEMPFDEFEYALFHARLAMKNEWPRELAILTNDWRLPRGAGRKSGGPT
jgi:3'-phosphoadenosine 5'-phosphosulfate sulfotransferase (PAPS reductase)/FAD synthetase